MFYHIFCVLLLLNTFTVEAELSFPTCLLSTKAFLERVFDEIRAKILDSYGTYWVAEHECFDKSPTVCASLDAGKACKDEELAQYYCPVTCHYCTPKNVTSNVVLYNYTSV